MPYIAPSYTPETELLISGGGLITFKTHKDRKLNLSSIPFSVGYSTNQSFSLRALNVIYWKGDKMRSIGEFQLRDMPDNYWGIGYENGKNIPKSDSTTAYTRSHMRFYQRLLFRTGNSLFLGPVFDINITEAKNANELMLLDPNIKENGTDIFNTGIGFEIDYDSRDFVQNAYEGVFISGIFTYFNEFLGGETNYGVIDIDYRQYIPIKRKRRTLAWQVRSRMAAGEKIPWSDMSILGGPDNMRGYTLGHYRDRNMLLATTEYRHMFMRKKLNKKGNYNSRFGYVLWLGAGSISPNLSYRNWLPSAGGGIRLELQPRMNIRVDMGIGQDETGFYVTFAEVF
ncbi:BamA/TamA family outer membrane protein [Carboxylicivirga marina]|uniref:BamA/TamA family outer membrane protein n=1 Tax=Carboxylicivirga marina TaxID=2800988 RepID=UPI0025921896|nr:BamA/TamA family outer membrane protein [uncultured Carboxylicivirga sp.]